MPVSPQDFELYSRMTGAPMPTDAMSRMQMAPEVFKFTKDFAKKPNILEKTGNLVKNIGRNTLVGAGLLAGMDLENQQRQQQELMRSEADKAQSQAVTMDDPVEEVAPEPELTAVEKGEKAKRATAKFKTDEMIRLEKARAKLRNITDKNIETYSIPANPTTADSYGQDYVPNQTASNVIDRKITQGSQIADSTPNIAEVLSETQDSMPVDESFPVGDARRNMRSVEEIKRNLQEDMETASLTRIGGPEGGVGKNQLAKFLSQKGLDQALLGAIGERMIPEPRIGDSSPLVDHPDLPGGEDDINLPSGTNTSPTTNLEDHYSEMRRMDAEERRGKAKIDRRVGKNLLEQRAIANEEAIASGFMSMSDEERAKETNRFIGQRAKDQMLEQMKKNDEDEERIKKLNLNQDRPTTTTPEQKENFKKLVAAQELQKVFPESQDRSLLDPLGVLNDPKFMSAVRQGQNKARLESNLISDRVDDFTAKFVEGAKSDIVRGARGNKSLGITRIPATNGDAQVGFVLANKPLDQSPTTATTYGFGVAPGAESLLDNQLNRDSFSDYMKRGMSEAKKGKKRKAGEIFEYLPQSARVVGGTASLGDIVM